jgi:uncharacterized membrane protein
MINFEKKDWIRNFLLFTFIISPMILYQLLIGESSIIILLLMIIQYLVCFSTISVIIFLINLWLVKYFFKDKVEKTGSSFGIIVVTLTLCALTHLIIIFW